MMKISGRLRHTSIHTPAATLTIPALETRSSASTRPKLSESTIATSAIWMLIQKPAEQEPEVVPREEPSQLSGSKR